MITIRNNTNIDAMMKRLGTDIRGGMQAGLLTVAETAVAKIVPEVPVVTSNLVNSIATAMGVDGKSAVITVNAEYGRYLVEGTGIYGPFKTPIVPKNKKALKTPYGPRKSVKGIRPNDFISRGVAKLDPNAAFETGMGNYLKKKGW
jgi:hypothetical protein